MFPRRRSRRSDVSPIISNAFSDAATIGGAVVRGRGLIVALAFRVITLTIALIGVAFYLAGRREVSEAIHDAEEST